MVNSGDRGFIEPINRNTSPRLQVLDCVSSDNFKVEILGYKTLAGVNDPQTAQAIYYSNQVGMQLKPRNSILLSNLVCLKDAALQQKRS